MKEFKGTQGKWYWDSNPVGDIDYTQTAPWLVTDNKFVIKGELSVATEQDANLIAAAPDLLEALQSLVEHLTIDDEEGLIEFNDDIINAKAAIAKALGESQ